MRRRKLHINVSAIVLITTAVAIFGTAYIVSWRVGLTAEENAKVAAGERLQQLAYQMSDKADRGIDERMSDVASIINSPDLTKPIVPTSAKQEVVDVNSKLYPQYSFVGIADTSGKVVASTNGLLLGNSVAAKDWFQEALKANHGSLVTEDVHKAALLAKLLPANPNGDPLRFIDIAGPLYDTNNTLQGVVGVHLSFNWIDSIRKELILPNEQRDKVEVTLLGADNKILLDNDSKIVGEPLQLEAAKRASANANGYTIESWPGETTQYVTGYYGSQGYNNYKGLGWKVLVRQPTTVAFAAAKKEADSIRHTGIILGTIMSVIGFIVTWIVLNRERKLEKAQANFVSLASHQLQSPATAVKQQLGLIVEGYAKEPADVKHFAEAAYESNNKQIEIINDLLNTARLETGTMKLITSKVDIVKLIKGVVDEQKISLKEGQRLVFDEPAQPVYGIFDETKIMMCVTNLVSNAIKYTPESGAVHIVLAHTPKVLKITVKDSGVGISSKDQKKLFKKFGRVENPLSGKVQGTGLGLFLVKQIIDLHKGTITIQSVVNKGTSFIIEIPKE